LAALVALGVPLTVQAQAGISEDFTGASTTNSWYFFQRRVSDRRNLLPD